MDQQDTAVNDGNPTTDDPHAGLSPEVLDRIRYAFMMGDEEEITNGHKVAFLGMAQECIQAQQLEPPLEKLGVHPGVRNMIRGAINNMPDDVREATQDVSPSIMELILLRGIGMGFGLCTLAQMQAAAEAAVAETAKVHIPGLVVPEGRA